MAVKIRFDASGNPERPTLLLGKRSGQIIGQIQAEDVHFAASMNGADEISFSTHKVYNGVENALWDDIIDFRLVYIPEYDEWFEIYVQISEDANTVMSVQGTQLGIAELSQINIYTTYIGTDEDIDTADYEEGKSTVFYNPEEPRYSLLNRLINYGDNPKAPHYTIGHVDSTIAGVMVWYNFDSKSIWDCLQEVAEDHGFMVEVKTGRTEDQNITREINVYDLYTTCTCGYRGDYYDECPECGSTDLAVHETFGFDTTIFVSADELGNDITFDTDEGSVKNCFKLEAGDDVMTAAVRNCNPAGNDYLWHIPEYMRQDMSAELQSRLSSYDETYHEYQSTHEYELNPTRVDEYNALVDKYRAAYIEKRTDRDLKTIPYTVVGYPALINAYYGTLDLWEFLEHTMMPNVETADVTPQTEKIRIQTQMGLNKTVNTIAVGGTSDLPSKISADNMALGMARAIASNKFQVKIVEGSSDLVGSQWKGKFIVSSYVDDEQKATTEEITVNVTAGQSSMELYCKQKIDMTLAKQAVDDMDITGLFNLNKSINWFVEELKKYARVPLTTFQTVAADVLTIVQQQINGGSWDANLKQDLYDPYYERSVAIEEELKQREVELYTISSCYSVISARDRNDVKYGEILFNSLQATYINRDGANATYYIDEYGTKNPANLITKSWTINGTTYTRGRSIQDELLDCRDVTKKNLDFVTYIGQEYLPEFYSFRRDDKYVNSNFVASDNWTNDKIFERAQEFLKIARNEIYKSAEKQHTISASLKDLLVIDKFKPIRESFVLGNWLRVRVDDEVYKLRLIKYELNYDDLSNITVDFSDVLKTQDGISDQQSVIQQAQSMATSYSTVQRQSSQGSKGYSKLNTWVDDGLDVTNQKIVAGASNQVQSWDEHGMLFQKYYEEQEDYSPEQLKILNSSLVFTRDNWENITTAVGKFYYKMPGDTEYKSTYGINAETIVGKMILGQNIDITNSSGSLVFNENGLSITNGSGYLRFNSGEGLNIKSKNTNSYFQVNPNVSGSNYFLRLELSGGNYLRYTANGKLSLRGDLYVTDPDYKYFTNIQSSYGTITWSMEHSELLSTGTLISKEYYAEDDGQSSHLSSGELSFRYKGTEVTQFGSGYWTGHSNIKGGSLRATRYAKYLSLETYASGQSYQWEWALMINNGINIGGNTSKVYLFGTPSVDNLSIDIINGSKNTNVHYGSIENDIADGNYGVRVNGDSFNIYTDHLFIKEESGAGVYEGWTGTLNIDGYRLDFVKGILVE